MLGLFGAGGAGCGASLPQAPSGKPHGVVALRLEHESDEHTYELRVRVDGSESVEVRVGERLRLAPGKHALQLDAIMRRYEMRDENVTERVWLEESQTPWSSAVQGYRSKTRQALVLVATRSCDQDIELPVAAGHEQAVTLHVGADLTCTVRSEPR